MALFTDALMSSSDWYVWYALTCIRLSLVYSSYTRMNYAHLQLVYTVDCFMHQFFVVEQVVPCQLGILLLCRLSNHEKSKKHKENATFLKWAMQEEEAGEDRREREGVYKEDQFEPRNLSASDSISSLDEVDSIDDNPIESKLRVHTTTMSPGGHSDLVDGDDDSDEPVDEAIENVGRDEEVVDFGAFGKRKQAVGVPILGNEGEGEQVSSLHGGVPLLSVPHR